MADPVTVHASWKGGAHPMAETYGGKTFGFRTHGFMGLLGSDYGEINPKHLIADAETAADKIMVTSIFSLQ